MIELRRIYVEKLKRATEALRLYEPLPTQQEFHACRARDRLLRGSNRSGKTLSSAVEAARAVTGQDPFDKYPKTDGRCYIVGRDEKHLGEVIYRKLFRAGAFKMIRDQATGAWRAYRPWTEADRWRAKEAKPAPPLIPPRFIKSFTWKSKGDNVPEKCTLHNGWEIDFFSSLGKPPRGSDLDLVWFDEEIVEGDWYPEMSSRLIDRRGCLIWGATPQTGTDRLYELHCRCEEEWQDWLAKGRPPGDPPTAREFLILVDDNPHFTDADRAAWVKTLSEAEADVRVRGNFAIEASKVYPEFNVKVHGVDYFDIPEDWTRGAIIDPGRQICAVLFAAIPPPDAVLPKFGRVGDEPCVVLYDELYIPNCDARLFGEKMAGKTAEQVFEWFIIDTHGGQIRDIGSGKSVEEQYEAALREFGVRSNKTNNGFVWGSDDVLGGIEAVRSWLRVRRSGRPTLIVRDLPNKLPNFKWEVERYRYKRTNGLVTDKPEDRGRVHLMACVRYLALYDPKFVEPTGRKPAANGAFAAFQRKQARKKKASADKGVNLGPPRSAT